MRNQQEMKDEADAYVERVKHDVLQYADDMLGYLSGSLQSALQAVNDNRASVNAERESLGLVGSEMCIRDRYNRCYIVVGGSFAKVSAD